jgi:hypothetical protein
MHPTVIAYPPGSGGVRLIKKLCNSSTWNQQRGSHIHVGSQDIAPGTVTHAGYPKYPAVTEIDQLCDLKIAPPVVAVHSLHSQVISKLFPGRRIVKIQANFYKSLCRWWYVFGKIWYQQHQDKFLSNKVSHCQHAIAFHAEYYQTNIDTVSDECWKIEPGQSDFADLVLEEFEFTHDSEFDDAWHRLFECSNFSAMKTNVLTCSN